MIDRRIKFRHIQCFVEIARAQSFKRAAEKLYLTAPAISKTLKELEDILGTTLFERSRSGVSLTRQGEIFLHFAQMSLASLQQGLDGVAREGRDTLSVGALPSVAAWLMPKVASEFALSAPDAVLRIMDGPHGFLVDRLRAGLLDMVIGRLGPSDNMQGISFTQLYTEQVVLVVRPGHPLIKAPTLARIADWPVIYPPEGSAIRPLVDAWLIANGIGELPRRLETVSGAFGRVHTPNSDAIWIISGGVVANEIGDGRLVRLPFDTALTKGPVGLMTRPDAPVSPMMDLFRLAVRSALEEMPGPR